MKDCTVTGACCFHLQGRRMRWAWRTWHGHRERKRGGTEACLRYTSCWHSHHTTDHFGRFCYFAYIEFSF
jgi:hypothetical protein